MTPLVFLAILLFFNSFHAVNSFGQNTIPPEIRLWKVTILTNNLDSLTRAFVKKGFKIKEGLREPNGIFTNNIFLEDGQEITLETTFSRDSSDWKVFSLKKYGNHIAGIAFEVKNIDSLYHLISANNILPFDDTIYRSHKTYFALDSCYPLDVIFIQADPAKFSEDSISHHPNHVFRLDWMLLSASQSNELRLRKLFNLIGALKLHEGCCDYWRIGPPEDFCFFRFDPLPPKAKGNQHWLSIEPDGMYFAY